MTCLRKPKPTKGCSANGRRINNINLPSSAPKMIFTVSYFSLSQSKQQAYWLILNVPTAITTIPQNTIILILVGNKCLNSGSIRNLNL
jgi:hypothetical protein